MIEFNVPPMAKGRYRHENANYPDAELISVNDRDETVTIRLVNEEGLFFLTTDLPADEFRHTYYFR